MTPQQIAKMCRDQIAECGEGTILPLMLPGSRRMKRQQFCPGAPWGEVFMAEKTPRGWRVGVNFKAKAVLDYLVREGLDQ